MLRIGKLSQQAIAAATVLAERHHDDVPVRVSASEIADVRELPRPVVAKVLAKLSQAGLTNASPGPTGGYSLARAPEDISLYDIVAVFERMDERLMCPFGPDWCETGKLCPLHDAIVDATEQVIAFLREHHLGAFRICH